MTEPTLIRLAQAAVQPWRNGGGTTRELFTWPANDRNNPSSAAAWQLRISVADISADGPFSAFPGVDRWFAVAKGEGVDLQFGTKVHRVNLRSEPLAFDGAEAPGCQLVRGATRDLNLMCQRDAGVARMVTARIAQSFTSSAPVQALFTTAALIVQSGGQAPLAVPAWCLMLHTGGDRRQWQVLSRQVAGPQASPAWWMDFQPHDPPA